MLRLSPRIGLTWIILGLVVVVVYLLTATGVIRDASKLVLILVFAIGPVAIMRALSIRNRLAASREGLLPRWVRRS